MIRRRVLPLVFVVLVCLAIGVTAAWAGFPHFKSFDQPVLVYGSTGSTTQTLAAAVDAAGSGFEDPRVFVDNIVVTGIKEGATTELTAPFEAIYVCVNAGSNVPNAANKVTFVGELTTSATFPAARNGRASGSLLTGPLPSAADAAAATGFTCPSGQVLEFDRVIFSGLVLAIEGGDTVVLSLRLESASVHGLRG